jgi:hypothetical protein
MSDITFTAEVYKVQTLTDGGIRVTLNMSENETMVMAQLAECQRWGVVLEVVCKTEVEQSNGKKQGDVATGAKRKSEWKAAEATGAD